MDIVDSEVDESENDPYGDGVEEFPGVLWFTLSFSIFFTMVRVLSPAGAAKLMEPLSWSFGAFSDAGIFSRSFSQKRRARLSSSSTPKAMMMRTTMAMGRASIWVSNEGLSFMRIAIVIIKSSPIMSTKTRV